MYYTVFVLILVVFILGEFSFTDSCLSTLRQADFAVVDGVVYNLLLEAGV